MDVSTLGSLVENDAALRRRQRLQPVGGPGEKIFPPTYPGEGQNAPPRHVFEVRRVDGQDVWCALVDSVQSQANRLEESLLSVARSGAARIPHVAVDFRGSGLIGIAEITSLDAPHRIYDAILRDSALDGTPFMQSDVGQALAQARPDDATAILEVSPTALLFGAWHSTGTGGGLGAKFARCLISEISAVNVPVEDDRRSGGPQSAARRTGSRMDPLGVLRKVEVYKGEAGWDFEERAAGRGAKKVRPSEINHGNIAPSVQPLGITCDYLEHTFVLSFAALRRLRFGSETKNSAARTLLAALGLLALAEQDARGYALRSRCDLICDGRSPLELVHPDGSAERVDLDHDGALTLYQAAYRNAEAAGFTFREAVRLAPQPKLVQLVQRSQQLALAGEGGEVQE